jgi:sporulation protein YlmC with PRC-barrel domain
MLLSQTTMRRVFTTGTAFTIGQIEDLIVDPRSRAIVALRLHGARNGDTLHWADIITVGPDAITVASADAVRDAEGRTAELLAGDYHIMGKRLITEVGDDVGRVLDVDFDPRSGSVRALVTTAGRVDGGRLLACGSYAAIVRPEDLPDPGLPADTAG